MILTPITSSSLLTACWHSDQLKGLGFYCVNIHLITLKRSLLCSNTKLLKGFLNNIIGDIFGVNLLHFKYNICGIFNS